MTLVPPLGIAGAGVALCGAYVVMLVVMHLLTRHAFAVAFEWRRLAQLGLIMGGLSTAGELLLPAHGLVGLLSRTAVFALIPVGLLVTGFPDRQELGQLRVLLSRVRRFTATPAGSGR